ncbi:MAG: hypothetical protein HZB33_04195 [Nitrospirae bacterium]|nr:hypothetical protein [Nitrospirota bacterium]
MKKRNFSLIILEVCLSLFFISLTASAVIASYELTVNSLNPASGVAVTVTPNDNSGQGNGTTSFTRTYDDTAEVTLTAPAMVGWNNFINWTGCDSTSGAGNTDCTVSMTAARAVTANYQDVCHFSILPADRYFGSNAGTGSIRVTEQLSPCSEVSLTVLVTNALTGAAIPNAAVTSGAQSGFTDGTGAFKLLVPLDLTGNAIVSASAVNYGPVTTTTSLTCGTENSVSVSLMPINNVGTLRGDIRMVLTWGLNPGDLDSHLTGPSVGGGSRFHVYYVDKNNCGSAACNAGIPAWLDVDDVTSYGPETVTIMKSNGLFTPGLYRYSIHHFAGSSDIANSGAVVNLYEGATLIRTFYPPYPAAGQTLSDDWVWTVLELEVDTDGTSYELNDIGTYFGPVTAGSVSRPGQNPSSEERDLFRDLPPKQEEPGGTALSVAPVEGGRSAGAVTPLTVGSCPWTAVSNDAWISITSGDSGTGNGMVGYSASANTGTSLRTGTITVGGQTFTVIQSGAPIRTLSVNSSNPASGVAVTITPDDNNGQGNGTTSFTRMYVNNTEVTLTAADEADGNIFSTWTGCNSTSGAGGIICSVKMSASRTVKAVYVKPTFVLTVNSTNPAGGVSISVDPNDNSSHVSGTTSFTRRYNFDTVVTLTAPATAAGNSVNFGSWTGCDSTSGAGGSICAVKMTETKTVTAHYLMPTYTLTVQSATPSSGVEITVTPNDNSGQGNGTSSFTRTFNKDTVVTLTAPETSGDSGFSSWTGCDSTSGAGGVTCSVNMWGAKTVTANYLAYTLTVQKDGTGASLGTVVADSGVLGWTGVNGSAVYPVNTPVQLTASINDANYMFSGWSGNCGGNGTVCNLIMNGSKAVTATFDHVPVSCINGNILVGSSFHTTIESSLSSIVNGALIKLAKNSFVENVAFETPGLLTLKGGLNCDFATIIGLSTVVGSITISVGEITIDGIIIR